MIQNRRIVLLNVVPMLVALFVINCAPFSKAEKYKNGESDNKKSYPSNLCEIKGIVVEDFDADWYREQYEGWLEQAEKDPKDEYAWKNCYRAKHYELLLSLPYSLENKAISDSIKTSLLEKIKKNIPDTYSYYACAYLNYGNKEDGEKALQLIPKEKTFQDYNNWICFQICYDYKNYHAFAKEFYDSGLYSKELLQTNLNELNCMEEGSIFVGNGDATIIPKWLIQDGMGKHKDKIMICYSFILVPEYCKSIYEELGIGEVPKLPEIRTYEDIDKNNQYIINDIAEKTGRTLYFSRYNPDYCHSLWINRGSLYDIGLIYIDSPNAPIDIYKEQERFFNSTDFSYLDKPLRKDAWSNDIRLSLAMTSNFVDLMRKYHDDGDTVNYQKIRNMMEKAVNRIPPGEYKKQGMEILKEYDREMANN